MSRTPVRQALNILEGEHLISIISKKGLQITQVSEKKMEEVMELRLILETLMIKKAIEKITDLDLEVLNNLQEKLIDDLKDSDASAIFTAGKKIHLFISEVANNETLHSTLMSLRNESYRGYVYFLKSNFERSSEEKINRIKDGLRKSHEDILQSLREKDEKSAVESIIRDVSIFKEFL